MNCASLRSLLATPRRACAARVMVLGFCVCLSVCLMPYFSDIVSLHVEKKVPMASARHCADFIKKEFHDRCFIQKLWRHLFTLHILRGYCSIILRTFSMAEPSKGSCLKKASVYFLLHVIISIACALSRIHTCTH